MQISKCKLSDGYGRQVATSVAIFILHFAFCTLHSAAAPPAAADLTARSLPLRTALHHDPTMQAPFDRLLAMYREGNRTGELVQVYRTHVSQFPQDANATVVLVRLLAATGDPGVDGAARAAVNRHAAHAYLNYLLYERLAEARDPGALTQLAKAIELEQLPARKRLWIDLLVPLAITQGRRDLALGNLQSLAEMDAKTPTGALAVARKFARHDFDAESLKLLTQAAQAKPAPAPEVMVDIELAAASAQTKLKERQAAAARLDRLLDKVTADYWRRPEILRRRLALASTEAERNELIDRARKRLAGDARNEAALIDLADTLAGFDRRREALDVLIKAGQTLPKSARIEKATLDLFDRLRDERGREAYLAGRVKTFPDRQDLVLAHAKSLYLLGRREEGVKAFDALLGQLDPAGRMNQRLEMARFLRRSALPKDAGPLFRQVVEQAPERLDVRRELAETMLALGNDPRRDPAVRKLLTEGLPPNAPIENLLDLVQFLIEKQFYREAMRALEPRIAKDPTNLDIRLLLLTIHGRLGQVAAGEQLIADARKLADTGARYRTWLESAAAFLENYAGDDEAIGVLLHDERRRLDDEPNAWTPRRLERRLAFAQVATNNDERQLAADMLRRDLDETPAPPPDMRVALRRRLIAAMTRHTGQPTPELQQQLTQLAQDDPATQDEVNARLLLLHLRAQRQDLATPLVEKLDPRKLRDPALLGALQAALTQLGRSDKVIEALERLTQLDPTGRGHWQRWMAALAVSGDEAGLRTAIRRLLAGVNKLTLDDATRASLQTYLLDSYWRAIGQLLAKQPTPDASLTEALVLVDQVDRLVRHDAEALWSTWTRAYILSKRGQAAARDEAIGEIERLAELVAQPIAAAANADSTSPDTKKADPKEEPVIAFPDGLSISVAAANRLLTAASTPSRAAPPPRRQGPTPGAEGLAVRWAFETPGRSPITAVAPVGEQRVVVSDMAGALHALDTTTGKLLWTLTDALPPTPNQPQRHRRYYRGGGYSYVNHQPQPARPVVGASGRVFLPRPGLVECRDVKNGRLLWRAEVAATGAGATSTLGPSLRPGSSPSGAASARNLAPPVNVLVQGERVLAFNATDGTAASFDAKTGKLIWQRTLESQSKTPVTPQNSGASLADGRLLVYGSTAAVLEPDTGAVIWRFDPSAVRRFPLRLVERAAQGAAAVSLPVSQTQAIRSRSSHSQQAVAYVNYLNRSQTGWSTRILTSGLALASPGVTWASSASGQSRFGVLTGQRLLLVGSSGSTAVRLDLPLGSQPLSIGGTYVGSTGRRACFLQGTSLSVVDTHTGELRTFNAQPVISGSTNSRVQAVTDGTLVYVTGPKGVVAFNGLSGEQVFFTPWPDAVAPDGPATAAQYVQYHFRGASYYVQNNYGAIMPIVDRVSAGVLYATPTPWRVAALVEPRDDAP